MSSASWTVEQRLKSMGTGASDSSSGATDLAEARMSTAAVEMTSQRALMAAISGGSASRTSGEEAGRAPPPEGEGGEQTWRLFDGEAEGAILRDMHEKDRAPCAL